MPQRKSTRRSRVRTERTRQAQTVQPTQPNQVKIFLPPPEAFVTRYLIVTMAAISWYIATQVSRCMGIERCECRLEQGFDEKANAEYIRIECTENCSIDTMLPKVWGMLTQSTTAATWDNITLRYDENEQKCVWNAGGFIMGKKYKEIQDRIVTNPLRYHYARGFAIEPRQSEELSRGKPKPKSGFIDLSLKNLIPLLYVLDLLRKDTRYPPETSVVRQIGRLHNVLLADLGDMSLGLREAIEVFFEPNLDNDCRLKLRPLLYKIPGLGRPREFATCFGDVSGWLARLLVVETLYRLSEESVELLQRWPSVVILSYGSRRDPEDTRLVEAIVIGGEDFMLTYHSVRAAAEDIGLSVYRLLSVLRWLPGCIVDALRENAINENEARGLASRLTPLYDSVLQGRVDRDVFYSVIRSLSSIERLQRVDSCLRVLRAVGGG